MDTCGEPPCTIPVLGEYDVVVCGGGAAGCAAGIAAARHGARTLDVERDGSLGGATVSQLVSHVLSTNGVDFQGVWHEWIAQVQKRAGLTASGLHFIMARRASSHPCQEEAHHAYSSVPAAVAQRQRGHR